ncbi:hypothetical protein [Lacipirellula limnantheis]|uniref:Glycoside hydrolase family 5 domain-containing protein n=1 Tax=Lacipirellula limnantheis TaxID=2528024 RepID=A0A517TXY5_9BACT|nr:hypothetical protein [Lacipirellula limnantheis]QDT73248.1 hypothetical protein I41_24370 [Lacipirellula limnantheis]
MRAICAAVAFQIVLLNVMLDQAISQEQPIALHPENGRYFFWRERPTILVTSGEHYGAVLNLDFDFERYLAALAADGLNHTRLFSGTYREVPGSFGITDNTLAPLSGRFVCPWAASDTPGYSRGGNKFDLSRWDEAYFDRLRRFMTVARRHGVVVEYNLFCPLYDKHVWAASPMNSVNNVNGIGNCPRDETLSLKHPKIVDIQLAFVRKLVQEMNEFDNLYYEVCNEPYVRTLSDDWQNRIVDEIVATEQDLPHRHLISLNVANGRKKVENPHPAVSIFNFHYCVPPDAVALNYGLSKVIGENETGFRGKDDFLYRNEAWNFLLAGGALFNNLDYSFTPSHPAGDFLDYESPGGGSPALRKQLGILKRFIESFDFVRMKPDSSLVSDVSDGLAARVLAEQSRAYAIYLHVPLPHKLERIEDYFREESEGTITLDIPSGRYCTEWVDVITGKVASTQELVHPGGSVKMQSPKFTHDIALRILASDGPNASSP